MMLVLWFLISPDATWRVPVNCNYNSTSGPSVSNTKCLPKERYLKKATWKEARRGAWDKIHTHVVKSQGSRWCIYHLPLLGIHPANPLFQIIFVKNKDLLIISTIRSQRTGICHCVKDSTSHKESLSSWGRGKWLTNNVQEPTSAYSPGTIPFWFPSHFSVVSFKKFCKAC